MKLTKNEKEKIKDAVKPLKKLVLYLKEQRASAYQEVFATEVVLEFLEILPDLIKI